MRSLTLTKSGLNKIRGHQKELKHNDIEDSIKSTTPGEWCFINHSTLLKPYVCFVNPLIEDRYSCITVLDEINGHHEFDPEFYIKNKIENAFKLRRQFIGYETGARLFYGQADGLPGLIIDSFKDKAIIQINSAGVDKFRNQIKLMVDELVCGKSYFLDHPKYREKEYLPVFENEKLPDLYIEENEIHFFIRSEVMQKVGFYYDHRENRYQLRNVLRRLNKKYDLGVDLFCYVGAWGMAALKSGVSKVEFVDQGEFESEIKKSLELNQFTERGKFLRSDVFKYLDEQIKQEKKYDLVLCDPPAFAKSINQKNQALDGYSKLHRKVFKVSSPGALVAFSSCTHYVSHEEFQKNILDAAQKEERKIQLIYSGMQGWDHPVTSLADKSNYIKSYFYLLES